VNINKLKPYPYLGQAPKKLEATIERGGEHKEDSKYKEDSKCKDSREDVHDVFTENLTQPKILVNRKNSVIDIGELIFKCIKLERSFNLVDFSIDEPKS